MIGLTLLLALLADGPRPVAQPQRVFELERLTLEQAERLDGQLVTCRVWLASEAAQHDAGVCYDCHGQDDTQRTVYFAGEPELDEDRPLTVRGRLVIIRHAAAVHGGEQFDGFTEIRFVGAELK